jgi:hypothetical protein
VPSHVIYEHLAWSELQKRLNNLKGKPRPASWINKYKRERGSAATVELKDITDRLLQSLVFGVDLDLFYTAGESGKLLECGGFAFEEEATRREPD